MLERVVCASKGRASALEVLGAKARTACQYLLCCWNTCSNLLWELWEALVNEGLAYPCQLTIFQNTKTLKSKDSRSRKKLCTWNNRYEKRQFVFHNINDMGKPDKLWFFYHLKAIICQQCTYDSFPLVEFFSWRMVVIKAMLWLLLLSVQMLWVIT